jgi:peptide/nickel transport system substrate-binding protein
MTGTTTVSRRRFLLVGGGLSSAMLLAACGTPAASPTAAPAKPAATTAPAAPAATTAPAAGATTAPAAGATTAPAKPAEATKPAAAAATAPAAVPAPAGPLKQVPRNRTLVVGITGNQLTDFDMVNPYITGISSATGFPYAFEPPFYYNAYHTDAVSGPPQMKSKSGDIPWLAESFESNKDFTEYTVKFRQGITWSDGKPFTAKDAAFTLNMLKDNAPKLTWSVDMKKWIKTATASDDLTLKVTLNEPNPRFFFNYFNYHFDIGIQIMPEHIWKDQDPSTFKNLDLAKGYPVTTGPWKLVLSSPQQRIWDRRDDWWAAKTGFHPLPAPERIIVIPGSDETKMVQMSINNETDETIDLRPNNMKAVLAANPKISTWTADKPPYGYLDWWPIGLGFNCMKAPFDDPEIRWALNHAIDRKQLVDIGYQGAGETTLLPFPKFPRLTKYTNTVNEQAQQIGIFDTKKTDEIMTRKGYAKGGDGFWAKGGQKFTIQVLTLILFQDITPILVQQLRKAGFDASFRQIVGPEWGEKLASGDLDAFILGHGGSVRDPYFTLNLYHSRYSAPTGEKAVRPYRWKNAEFDKLVDEIGTLGEEDPRMMTAFQAAMNIWIKDLPDIGLVQWFHRIPTNTTFWTGWPTEQNPYINTAYWHRTSPLWINTIKPAQ